MKIFLDSFSDLYKGWRYYLHLVPFLILAPIYFGVVFVYVPDCVYYDSVVNVLLVISLLFFGGISFVLSLLQLIFSILRKRFVFVGIALLLMLVVGVSFYFIVHNEVFMLGECISERIKIYPSS